MNDSFVLITQSIKDFDDMRKFAEAQHKTIIELSKKIKKIEDEKATLEVILKTANLPSLPDQNHPQLVGLDPENYIASVQLEMLKHVSNERELTLEEVRKVEIYSKILNGTITGKVKTFKGNVIKKLSDEELLGSLIENKEDERS